MADLLHFTPAPTLEEVGRTYSILRCDATQKWRLSGFVLSDQVFGLDVHYIGKSVPCLRHTGDCQWCQLGRTTRWVGYVPVVDHNRQNQFIMELTPGVMPPIVAYQEQFGTLRGCMIHLNRRKERATGRLDIRVLPAGAQYAPNDLPAAFDIKRALYKIFCLEDDGTDPSHPRVNELTSGRAVNPRRSSRSASPGSGSLTDLGAADDRRSSSEDLEDDSDELFRG